MKGAKGEKHSSKRGRNGLTSRETEEEASPLNIPRAFLYLLLLSSVFLRLSIALNKENWWQLHADEIYQSIEVAHIDLYGYGFLPYEFGGVPPENVTLSNLEEANREKGMYAMRSAIMPKIYKWVIQLGRFIRPRYSPLQVSKAFHSIVTGFLPLGIFSFTSTLFDEQIAYFAASLATVAEPLVVLGTHTLINSFVSPFLYLSLAVTLAALYRIGQDSGQELSDECTPRVATRKKTHSEAVTKTPAGRETRQYSLIYLYGSAACLGILCYVRVDLLLFIFVFFSAMHFPLVHLIFRGIRTLVHLALGFMLGLVIGGATDYAFYGHWFVSPIQWFKFNVHKDLATEIFGGHRWSLYIQRILIEDPVFLAFFLAGIIGIFYAGWRSTPEHKTSLRLLVGLLILLAIYSAKGHKEVRFLHDWIVLVIVFSSAGLSFAIRKIVASQKKRWLVLLGLVALYAASSYSRFPRARDETNERWAYKRVGYSGCINSGLEWIGHQADATGIFVDHDVYGFAGYTVLGRRLPIIAKMNREFREWGRVGVASSSSSSLNGFANATSFDDFSLWVSLDNVGRLVKHLLASPIYNYAIVPKSRQFFKEGFVVVQRIGPVLVFRRDTSPKMVLLHQHLSLDIPYGPNGAVLEEEGTILYNSGFYSQAIERLTAALKIDPSRKDLQSMLTMAKRKIDKTN